MSMPTSRIARDLMASGMDTGIHLTIAQASLYVLRRAANDLEAMRNEQDELGQTLQQGHNLQASKKYKELVEDINAMSKQVKHAPRATAEFEGDIEMLTRYLEDVKRNGHQKASSTQDGRFVRGNGGEQRRSSV
ncbi:MAG: hypothetical protein Q9198_010331 [Flavoplaca austrocitrina]